MGAARDALRMRLIQARGLICAICGEGRCAHGSVSDLHEEFVSRRDVMALPQERRSLIMDEHNCAYVCNWANLNMTAEQHKAVQDYLIGIYGKEEIQKWIDSLKLKYPPAL